MAPKIEKYRIHVYQPVNQDAIAIQILGYGVDDDGDGSVQSYQGFPLPPDWDRGKDGPMSWRKIRSGDELEPSIILPGFLGVAFEQALKSFFGYDPQRIASIATRVTVLETNVESLTRAFENQATMLDQVGNTARESLDLAKRVSLAWQTGQRPAEGAPAEGKEPGAEG